MEPILRIRQDVRKACAQVAAVKDPDMALLFCYIAARGEGCALPEPRQLGLDETRLQKARSLLVLYGVCSDSEGPQKPRKEIQWDPGEIKEARQHDQAFSGLCQYYEGALGRMLRKSELEILYSVYSGLGMPAEVLMLLINYCAGRNRLSSRFFEQEAYRWQKDGVETYAQAEEYLAALERRHSRQGEIMSLFGIRDRKLSESEQLMVDKWISHGYDNDLIALAYDRTVLRTGGLKWAYLDSILESWKTAGYKTRSEVEQGEGKSAPVRQNASSPQPARSRGEFESGVVAAVTKAFERKRLQRQQLQQARLEGLRKDGEFAQNERELRLCASRAARAALGEDPGEVQRLREENNRLLARRRQILLRLGHGEDYLEPPYECPHCKDQGYIGTEMCQCFRQACEKEQGRGENG